jgi:hypothetical protein
MRGTMRRIFPALLTIGGVAISGAAPVAVGAEYPFRIQDDEFPALSNCTFASYRQFQATASADFCNISPTLYSVDARAGPNRLPRGKPYYN